MRISSSKAMIMYPGPYKVGDRLSPHRTGSHRHHAVYPQNALDERLSSLLAVESDITGPHVINDPAILRLEINKQLDYTFREIGAEMRCSRYEDIGELLADMAFGDYCEQQASLIDRAQLSEDIIFQRSRDGEEFLAVPFIGSFNGRYLGSLGGVVIGIAEGRGRGFFVEDDVVVLRSFAEVVSTAMISSEFGITVIPGQAFMGESRKNDPILARLSVLSGLRRFSSSVLSRFLPDAFVREALEMRNKLAEANRKLTRMEIEK
ncbi:MAG: hypothetical protein KKB50_22335 [Planctomycetes bacterium]|nr:hypothetical protein [Planctomycetota bacterium]